MGMGEYMAQKDAENEQGQVVWSQVPIRFGGTLNTGHPEDVEEKD